MKARTAAATALSILVLTRAATAAGANNEECILASEASGARAKTPDVIVLYWGADAEAAERAGRTGGPGRVWLLLPRGLRHAATRSGPRR